VTFEMRFDVPPKNLVETCSRACLVLGVLVELARSQA
jgi:hypothetical protein